jgi:hypothetical protein
MRRSVPMMRSELLAEAQAAAAVSNPVNSEQEAAHVTSPRPVGPPTEEELRSETGADFLPLATALGAGNFKEADQLTRDLLVFIAGPRVRPWLTPLGIHRFNSASMGCPLPLLKYLCHSHRKHCTPTGSRTTLATGTISQVRLLQRSSPNPRH